MLANSLWYNRIPAAVLPSYSRSSSDSFILLVVIHKCYLLPLCHGIHWLIGLCHTLWRQTTEQAS